jgi:hypothetical protein
MFSALKQNNINLPFYIEIPSPIAIYGLLFCLFEKHLWKYSIFKKLGIIIGDDLNGKWTGTVRSSYDKFEKNYSANFNIKQSATQIKINGLFNNSKSTSIHENFGKSEIDNEVALFYFFRNEPNYDAKETMAMHEGVVKLIYNKTEDTLVGYYYSGRDRNNHGTINVRRVK